MAKKPVKKASKKDEEAFMNDVPHEQHTHEDDKGEPSPEEIENEEAQQDAVDEEDNVDSGDAHVSEEESAPEAEENKVLTCPKCHAKYDEDKMENKEAIVHGIKTPEGEMTVSYYCPPCALSWLERSSAKLA